MSRTARTTTDDPVRVTQKQLVTSAPEAESSNEPWNFDDDRPTSDSEWENRKSGRRLYSADYSYAILLFLIGLPFVDSLTCLTCLRSPGTNQLDNFRVTTRLNRPICPMEPIRCDRDQDVCVTITMHIGGGEYWLGSGCDRRINFQHMSCQNVGTISRNVQLGYVEERRLMQRVCVCTGDRCNYTTSLSASFLTTIVLFLLHSLWI